MTKNRKRPSEPGRNHEVDGKRRRESGITLIELLVVLVIISMLAIFAAPRVLQFIGGARTDTARVQVEKLVASFDLFRLEVGRYPLQEEGIDALFERPPDVERWNGPYVRKRDMLHDPWGQLFIYRYPGEHGEFDLYSLGADETEGGEDEDQDITSW